MGADGSRTSSVGNKRPLNDHVPHPRKRRRKGAATDERRVDDFVPTGGNFSTPAQAESIDARSRSLTDTSPYHDSAAAMTHSYGNNRLLTGFSKATMSLNSTEQLHGASSSSAAGVNVAGDSAIEISDEDMEDSEGGMVLNVQDRERPDTIVLSDDEDEEGQEEDSEDSEDGEDNEDAEEGEEGERDSDDDSDDTDTVDNHRRPTHELRKLSVRDGDSGRKEYDFIIDTSPASAQKKLSDLSREQREEQLKYAFYYLDRDQVDLGRPVLCLQCFSEGHLHTDCDVPSESFTLKCKDDSQVKLWISCCVCASKSHLVGDCPHADTSTLQRWSLANLKPAQIINMSLETGTRKLEREAESRGMRPTGLSIKGRAGRHTAGVSHQAADDSSDDEPFLRADRGQPERSRGLRYDRFDAPSGPPTSQPRGRGSWYATDSFGRQRSRSPESGYKPARDRRSPSPHGDSWRPDRGDSLNSYRPPPPPSPRDQRDSAESRHGPNPPGQRHRGGRAPTSVRPPVPQGESPRGQSAASTSKFSLQLPSRPAQSMNKGRNKGHKPRRGKGRGGKGGGK